MKCKQVHPKWEQSQAQLKKRKGRRRRSSRNACLAEFAGLPSSVLTAEVLDKQTEICRSMVDINNSLLAINETLKLINENLKNK